MASSSNSDPLGSVTGFLANYAQDDDRYQRMASGSGLSPRFADDLDEADSLIDVHLRMLPVPSSSASVISDSTQPTTDAPSRIFTGSIYSSAGFSENSSVADSADVPEPVGLNLDGGPFVLFCEFVVLEGCDASFQQRDFGRWVEHIEVEHLQRQLPESCRCWFCDDVKFKASRHNGDRQDTFYHRMEHIYSHIVDSGYTADQMVHQMRPDFDILKHLGRNHLIDEPVYLLALQYEEGPTVPGIYPYDFIPPKQPKASGREQILVLREKNEGRERGHRRAMRQSASRRDRPSSRNRR